VDVVSVEGAVQADVRTEIRSILDRCIHPRQDVLLPSMSYAEQVETFFIVASTNLAGFAIIAKRIDRELKDFDSCSRLKPVISAMALHVEFGQSMEKHIRDIAAQVERLVQAHVPGKERLE
jgi:hypothetical protein